jgi:hypothetical protein
MSDFPEAGDSIFSVNPLSDAGKNVNRSVFTLLFVGVLRVYVTYSAVFANQFALQSSNLYCSI